MSPLLEERAKEFTRLEERVKLHIQDQNTSSILRYTKQQLSFSLKYSRAREKPHRFSIEETQS